MLFKRILVIDHVEKFRDALVTILFVEGYHAIGAGSFTEAMDMLKKREFNMVIMEFEKFTNAECSSFLSWVKRYKPGVLVIIMGDQPSLKYKDQSLEEIVDGYVWKPLQIEDVRRIIGFVRSTADHASEMSVKTLQDSLN
ncbi:MAG: hypothetical protein A2161_20535 [Candidatus Schekmanbacteria bacterium RBG_13_48_7]|uniref:Response regulatory domain-containing protein n=1 Tax=Candidatus Schekmanbacteria bacterium RBG_13_48_7 TaxID=1817878 RepID=A0A1F7RLT4_9BACT|nr:MAG: hypothetical protein A2161_20535 [Candidatus Schekmanbacteria bacterium RBG_13_48_7]